MAYGALSNSKPYTRGNRFFLHIARPHSLDARKGRVDLPNDAIQKSTRASGRIEDLHLSFNARAPKIILGDCLEMW